MTDCSPVPSAGKQKPNPTRRGSKTAGAHTHAIKRTPRRRRVQGTRGLGGVSGAQREPSSPCSTSLPSARRLRTSSAPTLLVPQGHCPDPRLLPAPQPPHPAPRARAGGWGGPRPGSGMSGSEFAEFAAEGAGLPLPTQVLATVGARAGDDRPGRAPRVRVCVHVNVRVGVCVCTGVCARVCPCVCVRVCICKRAASTSPPRGSWKG